MLVVCAQSFAQGDIELTWEMVATDSVQRSENEPNQVEFVGGNPRHQ